jgi:crotonobetainyl-CoA:carnitine CoA-transferase CaiB-like acyl-CoA transferase
MSMAIRHAANLGEHNEAVLRDLAELSREEIGALTAEGVLAQRPRAEERAP